MLKAQNTLSSKKAHKKEEKSNTTKPHARGLERGNETLNPALKVAKPFLVRTCATEPMVAGQRAGPASIHINTA